MKPMENTENFVRRGKANVTTDPQMDRRVLDESFAAMDETIIVARPSTARIILRSRAARLAAAAALIIVGITMFMPDQEPQQRPPTARAVKSPAEMLSMMSLNMAYRRGGIEAMDDQSGKAFEMLGSQPAKVSIRDLLTESNGV